MTDQTYDTFRQEGDEYKFGPYSPKNIIAGDTDSAYIDLSGVCSKDMPLDEVIKTADMIGETVNDSFTDFMLKVFNSSPERSHVIETEREVVSDKSYFAGKKMYAMHVVNSEGLAVDKLKIMGLAIKKTDTPVVVQDFLKDIVTLMLDGASYDQVRDKIDSFKEHYYTLGIQDIGRPTNIKNLKKYEELFVETGEVKGFPYHAKASLYYNSMCGPSDTRIRSGDKIKVVYITGTDNPTIAIPADAEELPKFLDDIEIDWRAQWDTVYTKVESFLEPVGYDWASRQRSVVESFVGF